MNIVSYKLVILDLDGTLTKPKSLWEFIHRSLGLWDNRADKYQARFLAGEISYREFCLLDARLWKGMKLSDLEAIVDRVEFNRGIEELIGYIRKKGLYISIVSSGLTLLSKKVKDKFKLDFAVANELEVRDGLITGGVRVRVSHDGKGKWVKRIGKMFNVAPQEMIAIGDSTGDIEMFKMVGLSIAFNSSSPELERSANIVVPTTDLSDIVPFLPFDSS